MTDLLRAVAQYCKAIEMDIVWHGTTVVSIFTNVSASVALHTWLS